MCWVSVCVCGCVYVLGECVCVCGCGCGWVCAYVCVACVGGCVGECVSVCVQIKSKKSFHKRRKFQPKKRRQTNCLKSGKGGGAGLNNKLLYNGNLHYSLFTNEFCCAISYCDAICAGIILLKSFCITISFIRIFLFLSYAIDKEMIMSTNKIDTLWTK